MAVSPGRLAAADQTRAAAEWDWRRVVNQAEHLLRSCQDPTHVCVRLCAWMADELGCQPGGDQAGLRRAIRVLAAGAVDQAQQRRRRHRPPSPERAAA